MSEDTTYLSTSQNGIDVWYDAVASHAATHFADTPQLKDLVCRVILETELDGELVEFQYDFGEPVGSTDLVSVEAGDEIVYAKRLNRENYTPFNKSKAPQPCSLVSLSLNRQANGTYKLFSAWIGPSNSPSMPGTDRETAESKPYWMTHALAWGTQAVQPGTETSVCPW